MAKKKWVFTEKCNREGCKETYTHHYDTKRDRDAAAERLKGRIWLCYDHSRTELTRETDEIEIETKYRVKPVWAYDGYALHFVDLETGQDHNKNIHRENWFANIKGFPNGTTIHVKTTVYASIPQNPEPLPEWKPLRSIISNSGTPWLTYEIEGFSPGDGDAYVVASREHQHIILVRSSERQSTIYQNKQSVYRHLNNEDRSTLRNHTYFKRGQRIIARYKTNEKKPFEGVKAVDVEMFGTIIDPFPKDDPGAALVLTTDGREYKIPKLFISEESPSKEDK